MNVGRRGVAIQLRLEHENGPRGYGRDQFGVIVGDAGFIANEKAQPGQQAVDVAVPGDAAVAAIGRAVRMGVNPQMLTTPFTRQSSAAV